MKRIGRSTLRRTGGLLAGVFVCLSPLLTVADETTHPSPLLGNGQVNNGPESMVVFPLHNRQVPGGLTFDLDESTNRKLELQLSQPLTLNINNSLQSSSAGVGSVLIDTSVNLNIGDRVDITAGMGTGKSQPSFQSLGSIHCQNGVLEQGSYRASDCYFLNQANELKQDKVAAGLRYSSDNFSTAVSMFKVESSVQQRFSGNPAIPLANPVMESGLINPVQNNPLLPALTLGQSPNQVSSETTGLDLEFQVGLTMDKAGDVRLGLQLTRILDASFEAGYADASGLQNWAVANPYDSAKLGLDWSKGNFSGGVQGFYRDQVEFLNRESLDSVATFDVHFTWRTPWNANLSVGTSNVLNAGPADSKSTDNGRQDPFESVYGRIPYVRYQQDL